MSKFQSNVTFEDDAVKKVFEKLIASGSDNEKEFISFVSEVLKEARKELVADAKSALPNDPRKSYLAVRRSVYKKLIGGQVNILSKRRRGAAGTYEKMRTLKEGQRGGNRIKRSEYTKRMEGYQGADRGFILRFQNSGTENRESRYGNRGSIKAHRWFGTASAFRIQSAAEKLSKMIDEYIKKVAS